MREYLIIVSAINKLSFFKVKAESHKEAADTVYDNGELIYEFENSNLYGLGFLVIPYSLVSALITYSKVFFGRKYNKIAAAINI
jgi:hypothetical protein